MTLKQRIQQQQDQQWVLNYARLMATGKFHNTGSLYSPQQATADANNPALRLTAQLTDNKLTWK